MGIPRLLAKARSIRHRVATSHTILQHQYALVSTPCKVAHQPTLTTPFSRYKSSKRLPLLELGTGVSSTFIKLSRDVIFFHVVVNKKTIRLSSNRIEA